MNLKSLITIIILIGCNSVNNSLKNENKQVIIEEVKIGNKTWMLKNLDVSSFQNGDPINQVLTADEWIEAGKKGQPAWCYWGNDSKYDSLYGKLYNWHAINDPRGLVPEGWHIPSKLEWDELQKFAGDPNNGEAHYNLKDKNGWDKGGSNKIGFKGLPGGLRKSNGDFGGTHQYYGTGSVGIWWSNSEVNQNDAWSIGMFSFDGPISFETLPKICGLSIRCVKD